MDLGHQKIFLAGSTGLVGSGILRRLLDIHPQIKIRAVYYQQTRSWVRDDRVEYVRGDLRSEEDCRKLVRGCDAAVMSAAITAGAKTTTSSPETCVPDNLMLNTRLLTAFHGENIRRVVWVGSACLYQECNRPIREDELDLNADPHPAFFGFGWVTRLAEKLCRFWHEKYGMEVIIARVSNVFGPYAKFHPDTSNFIPALIRKAVDKMDPFEVWGEPTVTRDVIFSEDMAAAVVRMMERTDIRFDVFNIGSGVPTTVGQVVDWALKSAAYRPSEIRYRSDLPATIPYRVLDCSKARNMLGWRPRYSVEEGIERTARWWMENKETWTR